MNHHKLRDHARNLRVDPGIFESWNNRPTERSARKVRSRVNLQKVGDLKKADQKTYSTNSTNVSFLTWL